jgi:hypothetical protein
MTSTTLTNSISTPFSPQDIATNTLPQYESDEGALTAAQLEKIKQHEPQGKSAQYAIACLN